jgi:hypothetical protein
MEPKKQLYAVITKSDWMQSREALAVTDDADAAQKTLAAHGICFNTYEQTTIEMGGKEFKGDPENRSARRYVGIDRLYTRDEVIRSMEDDLSTASGFMQDAIRSVIDVYREKDADSIHITGLERHGEFIDIGKDEKVFDRRGQQIWPAVAPDVSAANDVAPIKKLQLKTVPKP